MAKEEIIFPNNIRNIRLAAGMKMTELARKAKLSLSAVSKIEKGVRRLNQKQLLSVCNILNCKLSDIFIKESDAVADQWQAEIKSRLKDNENSGLKIFGSGLRKIRQESGKTIAQAAKDAGMTLSVYHKIEVGQREIYKNEIEPLAKSFALSTDKMFEHISDMYKSGELSKQINKVKERVKSVLMPGSPDSDLDIRGGLYGAKLYDSARKKVVPVFGTPEKNAISFKRTDKTMILSPMTLEGHKSIYAVVPNSIRLGGILPNNCYAFVDASKKVSVGDLALFIDKDFSTLSESDVATAHIACVQQDAKGKLYGSITSPNERIYGKTIHKIVMIVMK